MTPVELNLATARLMSVLERELELLKAGQASEVASLIEEKMKALQDFEGLVQSTDLARTSGDQRRAIERIIQMAEENAAHMAAIRNGLRHVIQRLDGLNVSAYVGSYGRSGSQVSFTNATGAYNRKA